MREQKLLFFQWPSFMNEGIERALKKLEMAYEVYYYKFEDWEADDNFCEKFYAKLKEGYYHHVLSVDFAPLVSNICESFGIPYIAWVYDAPLHIRDLTPLKNSCNTIYFFDRGQVLEYRGQGIAAKHLPLAADTEWFAQAIRNGKPLHPADVSMVGNLYKTDYGKYISVLDDYTKGYLDGIIKSQMKVYGGYFIPQLVTEDILERMNQKYRAVLNGFQMERRGLEFMLVREVTGRERHLALALLSAHASVQVYTSEMDDSLKHVEFCGYADYQTKMPKVFAASKINLNISLRAIQSGIPLRVLDIAGCGGFVLSNFQSELQEYFRIGEEIEVYENLEDLLVKAAYYLEHEDLRRKIASAGLERIRRDFTFEERLLTMFKNGRK